MTVTHVYVDTVLPRKALGAQGALKVLTSLLVPLEMTLHSVLVGERLAALWTCHHQVSLAPVGSCGTLHRICKLRRALPDTTVHCGP